MSVLTHALFDSIPNNARPIFFEASIRILPIRTEPRCGILRNRKHLLFDEKASCFLFHELGLLNAGKSLRTKNG